MRIGDRGAPSRGEKNPRSHARPGEALRDLIESLLEHTRVESGRLELDVARFEPRQLAADCIEDMRPQADAKGLELRLELDGAPAELTSDSRLLSLVLVNLLGNAIKFTEQGSVTLRVTDAGGAVASPSPTRAPGSRRRICCGSSSRSSSSSGTAARGAPASGSGSRSSGSSRLRSAGQSMSRRSSGPGRRSRSRCRACRARSGLPLCDVAAAEDASVCFFCPRPLMNGHSARDRPARSTEAGVERTIFDADHETFRSMVKQFVEREVRAAPGALGGDGMVDREAWRKAGEAGLPVPVARGGVRRRGRRLPALRDRHGGARDARTSPGSRCRCTPTSSCRTSTASAATSRSSAGCPGCASRRARHRDRA